MNNREKNTYVRNRITDTLIVLLHEKQLADISVSELTVNAEVGRASFYRNFESLEDVLNQHDAMLIKEWGKLFENDPASNPSNVFGSLFGHYKNHADFYMILFQNGLADIMLNTIKNVCGPNSEMNNKDAYGKAFFAYGIYGWLMEWMSRGMQESPEEINVMLSIGMN